MASVVVALQGNPRNDATVDRQVAEFARRTGRTLIAVRVVPLSDPRVPRELGPLSYIGPHRLLRGHDDARLAFAVDAGHEAGVDVKTELVAAADPARVIAETARHHDAAAIFVEPPGDGIRSRARGRRLMRRLRRLASVPVFAVGAEVPEEIL
jgi:hypothetical protein